jgi:hypothetical protein
MVSPVGRRLRSGLTVSVLVFTALAPAALAGSPSPTENLGSSGPIEYLRTKFPNVVSQAGPATTCDAGLQLTGGGAAIGGSGATGHLNSSGPLSGIAGWLGEGRSLSRPKTVTSWAMCGEGAVSRVSSTENVGPNTGQFNTGLQCPSGQLPLSPGITGSVGDILLFGLFPAPPAGWLLSAGNAAASPGEAVFSALCTAAYPLETRTSSKRVEAGKSVAVIARCTGGEAVTSGGVKVVRGTVWQQAVPALALRPWDSGSDIDNTPDDGYFVRTFNDSPRTVTVNAYAVCTPVGI